MSTHGFHYQDQEIQAIVEKESKKKHLNLNLFQRALAPATLESLASLLTNKYAEGYPGKRYYGGCHFIDICENLAIKRAKLLFSAEHANVQAHSRSQAYMAVLFSALKPGEGVLGLDPITFPHTSSKEPYVSITQKSGHVFHCPILKPQKNGLKTNAAKNKHAHKAAWDYDYLDYLIQKTKAKILFTGYGLNTPPPHYQTLKSLAQKNTCLLWVDISYCAALVCTKLMPSPVPDADYVTTTTAGDLGGPAGGLILCKSLFGKSIDKAIFPGLQGGPLPHHMAAKAVAFHEAIKPSFKNTLTKSIHLTETLSSALTQKGHRVSFIPGGVKSPNLLLKTENSKATQNILQNINVHVESPTLSFLHPLSHTIGLILSTHHVHSLGMRGEHMQKIAELMAAALNADNLEQSLDRIKQKVENLHPPT